MFDSGLEQHWAAGSFAGPDSRKRKLLLIVRQNMLVDRIVLGLCGKEHALLLFTQQPMIPGYSWLHLEQNWGNMW